jgi:hypothetical protein
MKKLFLALMVGVIMMGTTPVSAQTATTTGNLSDLLSQISSLSAMIRELEGKITDLRKQEKEVREEIREVKTEIRKEFRSQLREGLSGDEVKDLQELLSQHSDIYPEKLVTGFFGPKTRQAVMRFQKKHGIETIGIVGPQTRAKLNALIATGEFKVIPGGKKLGVDLLITSATSTSSGQATTTPEAGKIVICHKEDRKNGGNTIEVALMALAAHVKHGDSIGACKNKDHDRDDEDDDHHGTTTPDVIAPTISDIAATTTASGAMITWTTNESAKGTVRYATTTPVSTALNQLVAMDSSLMTNHNLSLMSLTASTTYYFIVESTDAAGNTATSSQMSFMTL